MRAVIQRVDEASVLVDNGERRTIGRGLLVLLGIEEEDNQEDIDWLSGKIVRLRIFDDEQGVMNHSVKDIGGEILLVSQFTLHASTRKGNRPSYIRAAKPETAKMTYTEFIEKLGEEFGNEIKTGEFGDMMRVALVNNGPVTIIIDSKIRE